jgi:hypothetical protein
MFSPSGAVTVHGATCAAIVGASTVLVDAIGGIDGGMAVGTAFEIGVGGANTVGAFAEDGADTIGASAEGGADPPQLESRTSAIHKGERVTIRYVIILALSRSCFLLALGDCRFVATRPIWSFSANSLVLTTLNAQSIIFGVWA